MHFKGVSDSLVSPRPMKKPDAKPKLCFMGCPHMSLEQLKSWTVKVENGLKEAGNKKVVIPTDRICDKCGKHSEYADTFDGAIEAAKENGWLYDKDKNKDYCPDCQ